MLKNQSLKNLVTLSLYSQSNEVLNLSRSMFICLWLRDKMVINLFRYRGVVAANNSNRDSATTVEVREYELVTEAHA